MVCDEIVLISFFRRSNSARAPTSPVFPSLSLTPRLDWTAMAEALAEFLRSPALESPQWLEQALHGPLSRAGLPKLASVAHIAVATCVSSFALQKLSSVVCPVLFPKTYPPRSLQRKRDDWDLHVVSVRARLAVILWRRALANG